MTLPLSEDITTVFLTDFAVDAVFTPQGGAASAGKVIFDNAFLRVDVYEQVESSGPAAHGSASFLGAAKHGDTLTVNGTVYTVIGVQPDGTGMVTVILSREG